MAYIKPFNIMLLSLFSMQFVASNGLSMCLLKLPAMCTKTFNLWSAQEQCGVDHLREFNEGIQCLKEFTKKLCDESTEASAVEQFRKLKKVFTDICQQGSEMNLAFLEHKDCIFGTKLGGKISECSKISINEELKYNLTGNNEEDEKEVTKIACKHREEVRNCVSTNAKEICNEAAESLQRKLLDPYMNVIDIACNDTSAIFMHFWTLLLQAMAILTSLQYFRLTK